MVAENPTNRIADLFGPSPAPTAPRTEAQRQAAKRNGMASHGPRSAAGKARSRSNALRHGLLARHLMPPADIRRHDRLYRQVRGELAMELRPSSFTQWAAVDALVADYVSLVRGRNLLESIQRPAIQSRDAEQWLQHEQDRHDLRTMEKALNRGAGTRLNRCTKVAAERLADRVVKLVEYVEFELNRDDVEDDPANLTEFEQEELRELQETWRVVKPMAKRLGDRDHVAGVLRGTTKVSADEQRRLRALVAGLAERLRQLLAGSRDLVDRLQRQQEAATAALAAAPERLQLLQRYVAQIERRVERKLAGLRVR